MATDGFVLMFMIPMLIAAFALIVPFFLIDRRKATPKYFSSFGGKRLYLGLSGSTFASILYCFCVGVLTGFNKVNLGHIQSNELIEKSIGYFLYMFALLGPFIFVGTVLLGIPMMLLLLRLRLASYFGVALISIVLGSLNAIYVVLEPHNNWCKLNSIECAFDSFGSLSIISFTIGLGFAMGAKLPVWKNENSEIRNDA